MRKLTSKHKQERNKKLKQFAIGGVLIFVMLFSIVGYSFQRNPSESTKKINYNGFEFTNQNDFWVLQLQNLNFIFKFNPLQTEEIPASELNTLQDYSGKPLYIYSENQNAELEIYRNLNQIALRIRKAYLQGEEGDQDIPVKTCEDNFIILKETNSTQIIQNQSCVFIQGPKEELTKITDEFLFKIIGIKEQ